MTPGMPDMDKGGQHEYLVRSVAIVTLLFEKGILKELFDGGRLKEEDVDRRVIELRKLYPVLEAGEEAPEK